MNRRGFLKLMGLAAIGAVVPLGIPFVNNQPVEAKVEPKHVFLDPNHNGKPIVGDVFTIGDVYAKKKPCLRQFVVTDVPSSGQYKYN